jgi:hypothetical protein
MPVVVASVSPFHYMPYNRIVDLIGTDRVCANLLFPIDREQL